MKKNTVVTMMIVMLLSVFLLGMSPFVQSAGAATAVKDGIWIADTIEGFDNAYLIVFHSDEGTHSYVVQDGVAFGDKLPAVPERENSTGRWLIDGTVDSYLTAGTPLICDLSVTASYKQTEGPGDYVGSVSGMMVPNRHREVAETYPAEHNSSTDKMLVTSESKGEGTLKGQWASHIEKGLAEPTVWSFQYAGDWKHVDNPGKTFNGDFSFYYVACSAGYLNIGANGGISISPEPQKLLIKIEDGGYYIAEENGIHKLNWKGQSGDIFKSWNGDDTGNRFYLVDLVFSNGQKVNIRFDANGGTVAPQAISELSGKQIFIPEYTGNRYGYRFMGWSTQRDKYDELYQPDDLFTVPQQDITLYAVWSRSSQVTVTLDADGGTPDSYQIKAYPDTKLPLSAYSPVKEGGFRIIGWDDLKTSDPMDYAADGTYIVDETDSVLKAVWAENPTVWLDTNGGLPAEGYQLKPVPGSRILLSDYRVSRRDGLTLMGWDDVNTAYQMDYDVNDSFVVGEQDATLQAVWRKDVVVTFYNYDGSRIFFTSYGDGEVDSITLPDVSQVLHKGEDYRFLGWSTNPNALEVEEGYNPGAVVSAPTGDTNFYAIFERISVTISFDVNGGTGPAPAPITVTRHQVEYITLPSYSGTRNNMKFLGWTEDRNITDAYYNVGEGFTVPHEDVTLYAAWMKQYTVKFEANGGSGAELPASVTGFPGESFVIPGYEGTKDGNEFIGWFNSTQGNIPDFRPGDTMYIPGKNITLKAFWKSQRNINVVFSYNDGTTGSVTIQTKTGETLNLPQKDLSVTNTDRNGETVNFDEITKDSFSGWSDGDMLYDEAAYTVPIETVSTKNTIYLHAVYNEPVYVTLNLNGGQGPAISPLESKPGSEWVTLPDLPADQYQPGSAGRKFIGWSDVRNYYKNQIDGTHYHALYAPGTAFNPSGKNMTLYAVWGVQNEGGTDYAVGFFIRLDGVIPDEPYNFQQSQYTKGIKFVPSGKTTGWDDENCSIVHTAETNQLMNSYSWIVDRVVDQNNLTGYYQNNAVTANLNVFPSVEDVVSVVEGSNRSFDPETQFILWYVVKAQGSNVMHVDGLIVDRKPMVSVSYHPNTLDLTSVQNMPNGYQVRVGTNVYIGAHGGSSGLIRAPYRYGYAFLGWCPDAVTCEQPLQTGEIRRVNEPLNLYAQWKSLTTSTTSRSIEKKWVDHDNEKESRPESIDVKLVKTVKGVNEDVQTLTLSAENGWKGQVLNLPEYSDYGTNSKIIYNWEEVRDPKSYGYTSNGLPVSETHYELTNTLMEPSLQVTKEADKKENLALGETVTYTIKVYNTGNVTITNLRLDEELFGVVITKPLDKTTLLPKQTATAQYTYVIKQKDMGIGSVYNKVTATGTDPVNEPVSASDDETVRTIEPHAALSVTKQANPTSGVKAGDTVTYTVMVRNAGNVTLIKGRLEDDHADLSDKTFELDPGKTAEFVYEYTATEADVNAEKIVNTVKANAEAEDVDDPEEAIAQATVTTVKRNPELTVTKTADRDKDIRVGEEIRYTVKVENTGNLTITDINVTDTLVSPQVPLNEEPFTLKPGESQEFTYVYTATQADVDNGNVYNKAIAVGKDPNNDDITGEDDVTVPTIDAEAAIDVVKKADKTEGAEAGDVITYTVTVKNTGNVTLHDVELSDTLVKQNIPLFTLAPDETQTFEYTYTVSQADVDTGKINNTAAATGKDPKGNETSDSDTETVTTVAQDPELTVEKTAEPASGVKVGDTVTYTVVVENTGNVTVSNIEMTDTLVTLNIPAFELVPGQKKEDITYTYIVTQADVDAGKIDNTATATGKDPKDNDVTGSDDAEVTTVAASPEITVEKSADPANGVKVGDTVTYTVVVTNTGNVTISSIEMSDTLVTLSEAPFDLQPGDSRTITYTYVVKQSDVDAGVINNTATATGNTPGGGKVTDSDGAVVYPEPADPSIDVTKTASPVSDVEVGDIVTYTVVVKNTGNVTLTAVTLTDSKVDLDAESYTLAPNESQTVTYKYTVTQEDVDNQLITNTVEVEGTAPDGTEVEDEASADVTPVLAAPGLSIEKTADPTEGVTTGDTVSYKVVVTNTGNVTLHDIELTDTLVEQTAPKFTLAPEETKTFEYTYTVTQTDVDSGKIDNTATATGKDPKNNDVSASDDATVTTLREPGITVTKTTSPKEGYKLGDTVTYTIVVKNTGNLTLTDITITDDLTGSEWNDITLAPGEERSLNDTYVIKAADAAKGSVVNIAAASGKDPFDTPVSDDDDENITTSKIPLTIKAASDEKTYDGTPLTNSGWEHISGELVAGNKIQSVTVTGSQTNYGSSANVASAAVIVDAAGADVSAAYEVTYQDGLLNVLRRPVIVEAENKNKVYGEADPQLTAKVSGLIGGDTINYELSREPGEDVGMYTITPSGDDVQGNYEVIYRPGTLEITQRPLSIIAGSGSKTYDGRELTVQTFTTGEGRDSEGNPIGGGLIPGDNVVPESLTITGSIINVGTETNRLASSAQITNEAGKDVTGNYSINYVNGLLTITPAAVVVKADDKTKVYGDADPELTAHVNGLINENDVIEYSLSRAAGENVGNYTITPTGEAQQGNYIVTYETGTLTITPKPLTITALSDTKPYDGTALTKNSYIKTDLAAGDVISSVTVNGSQTY
ncbi:MAG: DUF11 domain-containing protein, partial [Anaerolineaceae bacterium]|nr:DUF11 domain-containing protein [Anaerolineaceae bacterium]